MRDSHLRTARPLAWVAGGSRGLGYAIAEQLGRSGYRVLITARTGADLDRAQAQLEADELDVITRVHDVRDAAGARDLVAETESRYGPIEVAVAVAGVISVGPVQDQAEAYDQSVDIMLHGPINVAHAVLGPMRDRGRGRIGIVTSIAGLIPIPHLVAYSAAKHGAVGFARALATELTGSGISVSTIIPGLMRTGGHWHADYHGRPQAEYGWFTALSAMPIVAIDAERAARIIVRGVLTGRRKIIFTLPARLGDLVYRLSPEATGLAIGAAGRLLPAPGDDHAPGHRADAGMPKLFDRLTVLARDAVRRFHQEDAHGDAAGELGRRDVAGPDSRV